MLELDYLAEFTNSSSGSMPMADRSRGPAFFCGRFTLDTSVKVRHRRVLSKTPNGPARRPLASSLAALASLAIGLVACRCHAQVTLIDFDNIPAYPAIVDSFGQMFPGLTLASGNQWLADSVNNSVFQYIHNRSISTFAT